MPITKELNHGTYHVTLDTRFSFNDNAEFREVLERTEDHEVRELVFNMAQVDFVDSAALGMLLLARETAMKHGKSITISGATGQPKKMFDMAKFDTMFTIR